MIIRRNSRWAACAVLFLLPPLACLGSGGTDSHATVSTPDEIKAEFNDVPCENRKRQAAVRALLEKMGAPAADISVVKLGNLENLILRKPGASAETVIVGAHYDKVWKGCGAIDNWSGIVAMAHIYRSLRNVNSPKTLLFVAFGKEEEGLVGSKAMVSAMSQEQAAQVCAMVNLDSFGMGAAQVDTKESNKKLVEVAAPMAKKLGVPYNAAEIYGGTSDASSFMAKKIPAISLHGLAGDWTKVLHSEADRPDRVNPLSVYIGYRLALLIVVEALNAPCNAWR